MKRMKAAEKQCAKAECDQNEVGLVLSIVVLKKNWAKLFKINTKLAEKHLNRTGFKTQNRELSSLVPKRLQTKQIYASYLDFVEVMQSTLAQRGVRRDKKENFAVCKVVFSFTAFHFICLCINWRAFPF